MTKYNMVLSTPESTVVAKYEPISRKSDAYQSEDALEKAFIKMLQEQGYEYLNIHNEKALISNLRQCLEELNDYRFSETEWERFFKNNIANPQETIADKALKIQEDYIQNLIQDDGSTRNILLLDKNNIHQNKLQVINQYEVTTGQYDNRYDVTVLINGLPLVHIELKRRGVALKEAFNQINRYKRESFWADSGLFEYVQVFVISNGTNTKYYSNTTRYSAVKEHSHRKNSGKKTSHSFEFTSFWADANNEIIPDLVDFTRTFFQKHTLLNILTRYSIFTSEKILMVMRPYQIVATESILNRIQVAMNYKKAGSIEAGGYIWHTTGSGKTLTSFKTAQLASRLPEIDKVIFVVDRKDLDYQTMKEYDRFEKGSANGNTSTKILTRQLENKDERGHYREFPIIVTTIQKLDRFISKNPKHEIYGKHVVMIFDECHRSQFGDMHKRIVKYFKKYYLFGFTGTPIFAKNASSGKHVDLKTTEQAFGDKLHVYTIVNAINDGNVLPFRVDYVNTVKKKDEIQDEQVQAIDNEKILLSQARISLITRYILTHFNQKTQRNTGHYTFNQLMNVAEVSRNNPSEEVREKVRLSGFNSILAVSSIEAAKRYYYEFKKQMNETPGQKLRVATIFSYAPNEEEAEEGTGFLGEENSDTTDGLSASSREFLEEAIRDYNAMFHTAYDTSSDKFPNYYKDLSLRMKNREVDLLIVVNMFLTGFDATTLNTLWVDKNLKMHGLIQAFSRTNRILNAVKTYGNIICFRNLQKETDDAIALFGDKNANGIVLLKTFPEYYFGYQEDDGKEVKGYVDRINDLLKEFPLEERIVGEQQQKAFIKAFGQILRLRNILVSFDDFAGKEILKPMEFQDYTSKYNDLYDEFRVKKTYDDVSGDIVFEMELVKQIEVNIDYILMLVEKYHTSNCKDKNILLEINRAIGSSMELRSKKELIEHFIETVNAETEVNADWRKFVVEQKEADLKELIKGERLKEGETRDYIENAFRNGEIKTLGTDLDKIMPPVSRFGGGRTAKKEGLIEKLKAFFMKYQGLGLLEMEEAKDAEESSTEQPNALFAQETLKMVAEEKGRYHLSS